MYDFKEIEKEAGKRASKKEIKKAVSEDRKRKKLFSFLEGPPTANAPPGLHHLEVRTYKDIINKFRYMQGFNVPRKAGWDCHGLPVEVQIEKKLGLNSKKEILKFGEAKFIKECKESVFSYIKDWEKSTEKLGYWVDLENAYVTLNNEYIESVWWSLKKLYDKKLLYEDFKVVPFCPRCQTPLSSHEVALGYEKISEESLVVKFKLKDKTNEHLLVWTTTPWTLPSNLAIAVNPKLDYAYVKSDSKENKDVYILAKELVKNFFSEARIIKTIKGKELIGKKYYPLLPYFKEKEGAFVIIGGDFVSVDEGTGLVHMAPAFGEVDYDACKKEKLPFVQPITEEGKFTSEVPDYQGMFIKDADPKILARLEDEGKIFKILKYEHDYPFCWRCSSPLMYYAIKSWFVKVTAYKKKLIELNKKINWVPKYIKEGRFGEWLENVKDWALSRKKFWGTPLPIWRCECGNEKIIGSIAELKKESVRKLKDSEIDLHKPWIDNVKLKCKCGKEMKRVPEVIDCWYDSGSALFAQFHYPFENKKEFEKRFPYDFISEAIDQTRGWFYTLHVLATILFGKIAYKNVICAGHIVDENGEKMSKTKGNMLNHDEVLNEIGVDATRLQFCITDIGSSKRFGINLVKQDTLPFLNILWNTLQYYKQLDNNKKPEEKIEDKWILSRLNTIIKNATENLENYYIDKALNPIIDFVTEEFSRTYIKIVRDREDKNVTKVCSLILDNVSRLLAPYAPNITDVIYQEFNKFNKKSVHLSSWPKYDARKINKKLESDFASALKIIELGLAERDKAKIGLKWPLSKAIIFSDKIINNKLIDIIKRQLNIKEIKININKKEKGKEKEIKVELDTIMTAELEEEGYAREVVRKIQDLRKKAGLVKKNRIKLLLVTDKNLIEILKGQKKFIKQKTNAARIDILSLAERGKAGKYKHFIEDKIKDKIIKILFNKT